MNLYDQLQQLQVIPDAYKDWEGYRQALTAYVIEHAYGDRSIAIFGAGSCNDIDLKMLAAYFEKVYLLDKDSQSMEKAAIRYGLGEDPRIERRVIDFTGLSDEDYRFYAQHMVDEIRRWGTAIKTEELAEVAMSLLSGLEKKMSSFSADFGSFDNVAAIGLHSQLISMLEWIWSVLLQTLNREENRVREQIITLNGSVVKRFNEALLSAARHHYILGCEEGRIGQAGSVQGAVQALYDIEKRRREKRLAVVDESYLIWPFNPKENKAYRMKLQTIRKY